MRLTTTVTVMHLSGKTIAPLTEIKILGMMDKGELSISRDGTNIYSQDKEGCRKTLYHISLAPKSNQLLTRGEEA